jgi:hypothetical protein
MRALNVRQGVIGGVVVSVISAASVSGRSADPLPAFAGVLAVALSATGLATAFAMALNRHREDPPIRW